MKLADIEVMSAVNSEKRQKPVSRMKSEREMSPLTETWERKKEAEMPSALQQKGLIRG